MGAGSMGANHARVISESADAHLQIIVDQDTERASFLADKFSCRWGTDIEAVEKCDAGIVATATETHTEIALHLLAKGIPLLVEKPLAEQLSDVRALLATSERLGVPLTCGFVERFNPVILTSSRLIDETPVHVLSVRHSPHNPRVKISVVQDLLIHDIDLAIRLGGTQTARQLHATSSTPDGANFPELADATINFDNGMIATLSASRCSQRKIRMLSITTPTTLMELDLLRQDVTVYRHVEHEQLLEGVATYRAETIVDVPFVRHGGEPLALQLEHFCDLVQGRIDPDLERRGLLAPYEMAAQVEAS